MNLLCFCALEVELDLPCASEMYNIVPWFDEVNTFLIVAIVIVGFITVSWVSRWWVLAQLRTFRAGARDVVSGSPTDAPKNIEDELSAKKLFSELKTVSEWHELGINLDIPTCELDRIEQDYPGNKRRMTQMLALWLRRTSQPSWVDVVSALQLMEENSVAENIRQKYIGGESKL